MKDLRRSMDIPGPGTYEGHATFYKVKKNYGVTVFGKQRRLEELMEIKKSKHNNNANFIMTLL